MPIERKTTGRDAQITSGYRFIASAAGLMRRCAGYLFDRQAEQSGWKVFYAVDIDIIKMYMAPNIRSKYAAVFGDGEDTATRELLARLIGDFIFRQFKSAGDQVNDYLFIIPPHDEELGNMIFALSNELLDALDEADTPLDELLADLPERQANGDQDGLSQWLIDSAPSLIGIFDGKSGPRSELDRFESIDEHRLLHVERYLEKPDSWTFPLPQLDCKSQDFESFTSSFEDWKKRLIEHKTPRQNQYAFIRDAYVMTMLEWLNQHMEPEKRRLVLITGTQGILNAASKYRPPLVKGQSKSFAELYIRHPQDFMVDNAFFPEISAHDEKKDANNFRLFDWLNLFFPKVIREGIKQIATFNTLLLEKIEKSEDKEFQELMVLLAKSNQSDRSRPFPDSMLDEWRTQVRSACISREINMEESSWPARAKQLLEWIKSKLDQGWSVEQLRSDLASRAIQSLSALYSSTVWLGLWSQVGTHVEHVRGIPALRFDPGYEKAQEYYRLVIAAMQGTESAKGGGQKSNIDIADMYSKLSGIDDSDYHGHVIHALAYATKGHWHAAKTLCKIALRTADSLQDENKNFRTGREAAYLLAISERRLARQIDDLVVARQYLQDALSRENPGAPPDLRFLSEAIAIDVARINFEYFIKEGDSIIPNDFERIWQDAAELYSRIDSEPLQECKTWICQQLSTNMLNLALIEFHTNQHLPETKSELVRNVLLDLREKRNLHAFMEHNDGISEFVYLVASTIFFTEISWKGEALKKLSEFKLHHSLPFDKQREKVFMQLAGRACI
jgi:hypothetical protein